MSIIDQQVTDRDWKEAILKKLKYVAPRITGKAVVHPC